MPSEDIAFGQYVVVTARWILIFAGLVLAVWVTDPLVPGTAEARRVVDQVKISFIVLALLAFGNFYLTLQLLRKRSTLDIVAYAASAADLVVITVLIVAQGGFSSGVYIFYFPALLAISVAFPWPAAVSYTAATLLAYVSATMPVTSLFDQQTLVTRLAMFVAVAFCGQLYYRIEQDRRRDAARARERFSAALTEP